jgi:hypothetical protein
MRRVLGAIGAATFCGCSLIVSTSGLSEGPAPTTPDSSDAPAPVPEAAIDVGVPDVDAGIDAAPRDPSVIGEWRFDDLDDTSGKGHSAELTGDAVLTLDPVRGKCVTLAGAGRVRMPSLWGSGFPPNGTLSFHVKYTSDPADPVDRTLFDGWEGARAHLFVRRPPDAGVRQFQAAFQPPNTTYAWAVGFTIAPSTWTHLVIVWKSGNATTGEGALYVDKNLVKRTALDSAFAPTDQNFELGIRYIGSIDDVVLYDRALSDAEALALD